MDIHLHVHFPDLAALAGLAGVKVANPTVSTAGVASDAKPVADKAETAKPAAGAKKATAAAKPAANENAAGEQAEIDGKTNTGCIIMIKRVAAMDGKDEKGNDKLTGVNKARKIIESFGGVKVSELPKDKWAAFIADCQKALDGTEAAAETPKAAEELFA